MSLGPVRPRFQLTVSGTIEDLIKRIETVVSEDADRLVSRTLGAHVDITVVREIRHRWSPCIQLEFRPAEEDESTVIDGLVGPHPNMWTLFAFININILTVAVFGAMLGMAQMTIRSTAWGFWAVPIGVVLLGVMYAVSQVGRRLAADQTRMLRELVEKALETQIP